MKHVVRICVAACSIGLLAASTVSLTGCDGPEAATTTKPIESNILKKLGQANQAQSQESLEKGQAKAKAAKRR
jgi:hypothetical protein